MYCAIAYDVSQKGIFHPFYVIFTKAIPVGTLTTPSLFVFIVGNIFADPKGGFLNIIESSSDNISIDPINNSVLQMVTLMLSFFQLA